MNQKLFTALLHYKTKNETNQECILVLSHENRSSKPAADLSEYQDSMINEFFIAGQLIDRLRYEKNYAILGCEHEPSEGNIYDDRFGESDLTPSEQVWMATLPLQINPTFQFFIDFLSIDIISLAQELAALVHDQQDQPEQLEALRQKYTPFADCVFISDYYNELHAKLLGGSLRTLSGMTEFFINAWSNYLLIQNFAFAYSQDPERFGVSGCLESFLRYYGYSLKQTVHQDVRRSDKDKKEGEFIHKLMNGSFDPVRDFGKLPIFYDKTNQDRLLISEDLFGLLANMLDIIINDHILIKKCKNCGRFFISLSRSNIEYCTRPIGPNSRKTCRDVGPAHASYKKLKSDTIKSESRRLYNLLYRRKNYHYNDAEVIRQFEEFRAENQQKKKDWKKGHISDEEYMNWLKDMSLLYTSINNKS